MKDHDSIFLQPACCASEDVGRLWCEHDAPVNCEDGVQWTHYVRADLAEARESELRAEVERLRGMVPKWVLVSERLPEVIVSDDGEYNSVLAFDPGVADNLINIFSTNTAWLAGPYSTATHWMPLPEAPHD